MNSTTWQSPPCHLPYLLPHFHLLGSCFIQIHTPVLYGKSCTLKFLKLSLWLPCARYTLTFLIHHKNSYLSLKSFILSVKSGNFLPPPILKNHWFLYITSISCVYLFINICVYMCKYTYFMLYCIGIFSCPSLLLEYKFLKTGTYLPPGK